MQYLETTHPAAFATKQNKTKNLKPNAQAHFAKFMLFIYIYLSCIIDVSNIITISKNPDKD